MYILINWDFIDIIILSGGHGLYEASAPGNKIYIKNKEINNELKD